VSYLFGQYIEKHNRPELLYRKKKMRVGKNGGPIIFPWMLKRRTGEGVRSCSGVCVLEKRLILTGMNR
jgi:hypothetical protein